MCLKQPVQVGSTAKERKAQSSGRQSPARNLGLKGQWAVIPIYLELDGAVSWREATRSISAGSHRHCAQGRRLTNKGRSRDTRKGLYQVTWERSRGIWDTAVEMLWYLASTMHMSNACVLETRICRHMRGACDRKRVRSHSEALASPAANPELQHIGMGSNEERAFSRMIRNPVLTSQAWDINVQLEISTSEVNMNLMGEVLLGI